MSDTLAAAPALPATAVQEVAAQTIVSFDVEEHYRIEAAAHLVCDDERRRYDESRVDIATRWILERLDTLNVQATFFIVGEIARRQPDLVRDIAVAGHEVASHSWDHRRVHRHTPESFREDVRLSKDALEQASGSPVVGYRAPTFSVMRETAWALDILAEEGMVYDSSIYPVRHDRYGVPRAPRWPFLARGREKPILELPPLTWRACGANLPVGGGGYFRLLPLWFMDRGIAQAARLGAPPVAMLYFHPWEFDPEQRRLPLGRVSRFRTYVGLDRSQARLGTLLGRHRFCRAVDVARRLRAHSAELATFDVTA